ncbi:MAG: PP2C family protein-serine/threonine phosphatase [Gammaproteobacteria bacterium]|nr:PP2C family protein-serine/threonine phosphatase [Gammaproteobacteria bacterium]MBU1603550.1 PP2C family protein-serine/threonine phosphatase [Gammaproteobacteria bacterium]MBU2432347.1 PP2C family protein-serine/threonine phosphatase [Gammaproteobacteria bacterium]MBU2447689.1 PP2C family protein-serine/threonine phosphatase [Gammaproteobacteria bacterium]
MSHSTTTSSAKKQPDHSGLPAALLNASGLRSSWRKLSYCWHDPDAPADVAAAHRFRQFRALLQQMPVSAFDCMVCSLIYAWIFWADATPGLLIGWCAAVWASSGAGLIIWQRHKAETNHQACARAVRLLTASVAISGLLFAVMLAYLFGRTNITGQILVTAFFATAIPHGAFHTARWPWAGALWGSAMCVGGTFTLLLLYGTTYLYLAVLLSLYGISVVASVLITSRLFVKSLIAESEVERQKQVIGLLLNDFEDDASDWLWETDEQGRLRHISTRLASTLDTSVATLHAQPMSIALLGRKGSADAEGRQAFSQLEHAFASATTFRDIVVPIEQAGEIGWWSLSGKPLTDAAGTITGWRGVGTDITAERRRQKAERDLLASREAAARLAGELDTARRIQMGLLPDLATSFAGETRFSIAAILEPAREVGGDYYECFRLDERRICFAVADVSGKGVPASLFMAMTKALAASMARLSKDLGEAVRDVANELDRNNPEMLFVTAFIAVLDIVSGELSFVSAGHDAPVLLRHGMLSRIDLGEALGPPMCGVPDYPFRAVTRQLEAGDTLYLFTDGVTEATDGQDFFGTERLLHSLAAQPAQSPVAACADALRVSVRSFEANHLPADDLTILVLRWHGGAGG